MEVGPGKLGPKTTGDTFFDRLQKPASFVETKSKDPSGFEFVKASAKVAFHLEVPSGGSGVDGWDKVALLEQQKCDWTLLSSWIGAHVESASLLWNFPVRSGVQAGCKVMSTPLPPISCQVYELLYIRRCKLASTSA
eukprot:1148151-Pelagomonas_calceolata.AAC.9